MHLDANTGNQLNKSKKEKKVLINKKNTTDDPESTQTKPKQRVVIKRKKVTKDKCVFPFTYKRNEYNDCLDTGKRSMVSY